MKNHQIKLFDYELTFIISQEIKTKTLIDILQLFCEKIVEKGGVVMDLKVSTKTPKVHRTFRLNKLSKSEKKHKLYSDIKKKYLFTLTFKANTKLLNEVIYNLRIRKLMSKYVCLKVKHNY